MAVGADSSSEGVGVHLLVHDCALQGFHDPLSVIDRQSDFAVAQMMPTLVDPHLLPTNIAEFVPPSIEIVHFLHRSLDGRRIVNYIQWQSRDLFAVAHKLPEFRKEWTTSISYRTRSTRIGTR